MKNSNYEHVCFFSLQTVVDRLWSAPECALWLSLFEAYDSVLLQKMPPTARSRNRIGMRNLAKVEVTNYSQTVGEEGEENKSDPESTKMKKRGKHADAPHRVQHPRNPREEIKNLIGVKRRDDAVC